MTTSIGISDQLRRRIVADLHLGRIRPGGRLPSLRMVAREFGISVRAAARAYSALEREGLVTVRGRSGIYLVLPEAADITLEAPLDWFADMLKDAWSRRISLVELNEMIQDLVANPMVAACVESTRDHMDAFCTELAEDFALKTKAVTLTPDGAEVDGVRTTLLDALADIDFVVTTAFHASEVQAAADMLDKPVVVVSVNDTIVDALERQLENRAITVVANDPAFVERFKESLVDRFRERGELRAITIDELRRDATLIEGTTTLYTRAARKELNEQEYHLLPPPVPFLSANAARRVVQCMLSTFRERSLQAA